MSKKHVYRVGDKIRVINPRVVERVGYPKSVYDYVPSDNDLNCYLAEQLLTGCSVEGVIKLYELINKGFNLNNKSHWKVRHLSSYLKAKSDGFGGKERRVHFLPLSYWPGCTYSDCDEFSITGNRLSVKNFKPFETKVISKRVARTGNYYPPSVSDYGDDYDYWPGGLDNSKSVVIINTQYGEFVEEDIEPVKD